jgi:hypothetical protein
VQDNLCSDHVANQVAILCVQYLADRGFTSNHVANHVAIFCTEAEKDDFYSNHVANYVSIFCVPYSQKKDVLGTDLVANLVAKFCPFSEKGQPLLRPCCQGRGLYYVYFQQEDDLCLDHVANDVANTYYVYFQKQDGLCSDHVPNYVSTVCSVLRK